MSDLKERLRARHVSFGITQATPINPDGPEAADHIQSLEADLEKARERLALASAFTLERGWSIESRGHGKWAVVDGPFVLNRDGEWEHEPLPSSRTEEFLARARFDLEEAFEAAAQTLSALEGK